MDDSLALSTPAGRKATSAGDLDLPGDRDRSSSRRHDAAPSASAQRRAACAPNVTSPMGPTVPRVCDSSGFTVSDALTIGVLIANAILAYLTLRTSKAAEHSAIAAEKGAAAADKQAAAATEQVRVAGEQVDTANRALAVKDHENSPGVITGIPHL
jgi:hypothetical protein